MPPRHAYWTILIGVSPTAFRAHERDELLPTFERLRAKHPEAVLRWFARGRVWINPEEARAAAAPPASDRGRGSDWRPGGAHRDPRDRFRGRKPDKEGRTGRPRESALPPGAPAARPPAGRKPWDRNASRPGQRPPWSKPRDHRAQGPRPDNRKPQGPRLPWQKPHEARPQGSRPPGPRPPGAGARPWDNRPRDDRPRGGMPDDRRPQGARPPWSKKPYDTRPQGSRPPGPRPPGAGTRPWDNRPRVDRPRGGRPDDRRPQGARPPWSKKPYDTRPQGSRPPAARPPGASTKPPGRKPTGPPAGSDGPFRRREEEPDSRQPKTERVEAARKGGTRLMKKPKP
jgi:hypothetical protein